MSEYSEVSNLLHDHELVFLTKSGDIVQYPKILDHELVLFSKIWGYWSISPKNLGIWINIHRLKKLYESVQSSDGYLFFFPLQCQ